MKLIGLEVKSLRAKQLVGAEARITQHHSSSWSQRYTLQPQTHCGQITHLSSWWPLWIFHWPRNTNQLEVIRYSGGQDKEMILQKRSGRTTAQYLQNHSLSVQQASLAQMMQDRCGILFIFSICLCFPSFAQNYCEDDMVVKSTVVGMKQT